MSARTSDSPWMPTMRPGTRCPHCGTFTAYDETRVVGTLHLHSWHDCDCRARGKRILTIQKQGPAFAPPLLLAAVAGPSVDRLADLVKHDYVKRWDLRIRLETARASAGMLHEMPGGAVICLHGPYQPLLLPARATVRVFSFGGGVQSHAVLALQALGKMHNPYDVFVFANVGADSENPETLDYIERYTKPFCEKHGIKFVEVQKQRGRGKVKTPDTLWEALHRNDRSIVIPARMGHNGALGNRNCTDDFKIKVVDRLIKQQGITHVVVGLGISVDELQRARDMQWHDNVNDRPLGFWKRREYPLITLRLTRAACKKLIDDAGLPEPPKSSCYFCPFHKRAEWVEMKREEPELFARAVEVEHTINRKRLAINRDGLFLHPDLVPLDQAVADQPLLFPVEIMDQCDSGYCMT